MKRSDLEKEGKKWVADGIISGDQLNKILSRYEKKASGFLLVLFASILTSLGVLIFVFSDWAQFPHISRIAIMIIFMLALYITGDLLFKKYSELFGISFIILGYIFFGAGMLLTLMIYNVTIYSAWPFVIWSIIGLLLYITYKHPYILAIGLIVIVSGQLYSGISLSMFNWIIFIIFIVGYFYFILQTSNRFISYLFAIVFSLQMLCLTLSTEQQYFWLIIYFLIMYLAAELLSHQMLKEALMNISLMSVFILKIFESFLLQNSYFLEKLEMEIVFFIVWLLILGITLWFKWSNDNKLSIIDLILFIPLFFLSYAYIYIMISMFIFSVYWLIVGYQKELEEKVLIGTFGFLISTFTVYIQFAWDTINKSLFFLIGGVLLFIISFIFERRRRSIIHKGGDAE